MKKTRRGFLKLLAKVVAVIGVTATAPSVALSTVKPKVYGGKAGGSMKAGDVKTTKHYPGETTPLVSPDADRLTLMYADRQVNPPIVITEKIMKDVYGSFKTLTK